jgi:ABC-type transport system involved in cytochrome bd biosynthesis fused ATPase/permease subunit
VFFLDEPTSGLDPATGRDVLRLLRRLAGAGTTMVLTTHSPTDIDLCDRIVFLARSLRYVEGGTANGPMAPRWRWRRCRSDPGRICLPRPSHGRGAERVRSDNGPC